jgi:hypothetical protein
LSIMAGPLLDYYDIKDFLFYAERIFTSSHTCRCAPSTSPLCPPDLAMRRAREVLLVYNEQHLF